MLDTNQSINTYEILLKVALNTNQSINTYEILLSGVKHQSIYQYKKYIWNTVESEIKHHNSNPPICLSLNHKETYLKLCLWIKSSCYSKSQPRYKLQLRFLYNLKQTWETKITGARGTNLPPPFFLTFCLQIYFQ